MTNTEKSRRWREKIGADGYRAYKRSQYAKHREHILAKNKRWEKQRDPEKRKEYYREYYRKNREQYLKYQKSWRDENPERTNITARKASSMRRARKRLATIGDLTDIAKIYARCADLRQGFKGLVVDHIVPLCRGGMHEASNLQIIYDFENRRKADKLNYKPRVIFK
jgi:5-methylcytosine-specific restriction endonuclease McrA